MAIVVSHGAADFETLAETWVSALEPELAARSVVLALDEWLRAPAASFRVYLIGPDELEAATANPSHDAAWRHASLVVLGWH